MAYLVIGRMCSHDEHTTGFASLLVDWPRSGPVPDRGLFWRLIKRPDRTVQHSGTAVRSGPRKSWTGPYSPVLDWTVWWVSHFLGIWSIVALLLKRYS